MIPVSRKLLLPVLFCLLGAVLLWVGRGENLTATGESAAGLTRSQSVIDAKIARKQAKVESGQKKPQHPDGYASFRSMVRPHPEGANVMQLLIEAKKQVEVMPTIHDGDGGDRDAGLWNWEWLGPGNIGGRVRAVMTHPDEPGTLWAGSAGGGIWKTTNGGSSWYPLHDLLPSLAISSLTMDPTDPDVIYAGTGEGFSNLDALPGAGVFKSTDGGGNWTQLTDSLIMDAKHVNDIAHHPVHSGWLLACGTCKIGFGRVWRSIDGGEHWNTTLETVYAATDVKYDPDDPAVVIVGTVTGAYRSTNAGYSWTEISVGGTGLPDNTGRCEITFGQGNDVVFASCDVPRAGDDPQGEIWRSLDNGLTWTQRSTPYHLGGQGVYDNVIWLEPGSMVNLMVGGIGLFMSLDGGGSVSAMSNWRHYHTGLSAHADQHAITPHINYADGENVTIYIGNDGGVQAATLGFATQPLYGWVNLANNLGITQFYHGDASPDGSVILGGSQDNDDLRYRDFEGAQGWHQANTGDGTYVAIDPVNPLNMYASYIHLEMERSTNGGGYWYDIYAGLMGMNGIDDAGDPTKALFLAPFALDKVLFTQVILAGGESIWRTTDAGSNWANALGPRSGTPLCSAIEISPTAGHMVAWVGYNYGQIWKTEDSSSNWTEVEGLGGNLPDRHITDIEISPHDPHTVIVTMGGYYTDRIWLTRDNGASWDLINGTGEHTLPAIQRNCVTFHPSNPDWIYVGTDLGMFASEDLGQTWSVTSRYGNNEGPVFTEIADFIWHSGNTLVAVTHGRGMYQCKPLEVVWVDQSNTGEEDGTEANPWSTFWRGNGEVGNGSTLIIKGGDYDEGQELITKRIIIEGDEGTVLIH
jgi:hypothetical protein